VSLLVVVCRCFSNSGVECVRVPSVEPGPDHALACIRFDRRRCSSGDFFEIFEIFRSIHVLACLLVVVMASATQRISYSVDSIDWSNVVDFSKHSFWLCVASIAFAPLFWNIVARSEYKTKWMSRLFGSAYTACYTLAAIIFLLSLERDWAYDVVHDQPSQDV
jgi:hypothetical protein